MNTWKKINDTVTISRILSEKAQKWYYGSSEELYTDGEDGYRLGSDSQEMTLEQLNEALEQYQADAEAMEAEEIMDDLGEMRDIELDARNTLPGWEYDDEHVILKNAAGRYIVGKIYDNCVSIGSGHVREFESPVEAVKALQKGFEIRNVGPLGDQERAKRSEALCKAQAKYDGQQRKIMIRLDERTDADLIAKIEAQPSMTAYIKELVRKDMER